MVGQISNRRLGRKVLESKKAKRRRNAIPQAYLYIYAPSVGVKLLFVDFKLKISLKKNISIAKNIMEYCFRLKTAENPP